MELQGRKNPTNRFRTQNIFDEFNIGKNPRKHRKVFEFAFVYHGCLIW